MKQRVITAIILCLFAIPVCIFSGTVVFPIAMAFIGFMGVYEMLGCMGMRKNYYISVPLYVFSLIFLLLMEDFLVFIDRLAGHLDADPLHETDVDL